MALTVNWRWNMPQVGSPNYGSEQNAKYLNEGLGAIAQGILKAGENRRADEKQKLQRDIFNQNKKRSDFDMNRQGKQDEWLYKFYDQYFGSTDPFEDEYLSLKDELSQIPAWQLELLMGRK